MSRGVLFGSLLTYSLLPGLAKVVDSRALFALNLPIIAALVFLHRKKAQWSQWDLPVLAFLGWSTAYVPLTYLLVPGVRGGLLGLGAFTFLLPMAGFVVSRKVDFGAFASAVVAVGLVHIAFGFVTYGFVPVPERLADYVVAIKEGTAAFRMTSVSGSLAFATLSLITLVLCLGFAGDDRRGRNAILYLVFAMIAFFGAALSLQRAAWLGALAAFGAFVVAGTRRLARLSLLLIAMGATALVLFWSVLGQVIDPTVLADRLDSIMDARSPEGAVGERAETWLASIDNVLRVPTGVGLGQAGQMTRVAEETTEYVPVFDGDYFKIVSEAGLPGLLLVVFMFLTLARGFLRAKDDARALIPSVALLAIMVQMIGSNVSEFYFVNFLQWAMLGYVAQAYGAEPSPVEPAAGDARAS